MSDSVQPCRWQPIRLPRPWDSPGKNTGVGCHFLLQCMKVKSESEIAQSCPTSAYQAPPSMGFSRMYWSGLPLPSLVRPLAASKRIYTNTHLSGLLLPLLLSPQQATADQHLSRRPSNTQASLTQSPVGSLLLSPGSWYAQDFVFALWEFLFPSVLWKFCYQIPLPFQIRFSGYSQSLCQIPSLRSISLVCVDNSLWTESTRCYIFEIWEKRVLVYIYKKKRKNEASIFQYLSKNVILYSETLFNSRRWIHLLCFPVKEKISLEFHGKHCSSGANLCLYTVRKTILFT